MRVSQCSQGKIPALRVEWKCLWKTVSHLQNLGDFRKTRGCMMIFQ
jgi:hypothetical protein